MEGSGEHNPDNGLRCSLDHPRHLQMFPPRKGEHYRDEQRADQPRGRQPHAPGEQSSKGRSDAEYQPPADIPCSQLFSCRRSILSLIPVYEDFRPWAPVSLIGCLSVQRISRPRRRLREVRTYCTKTTVCSSSKIKSHVQKLEEDLNKGDLAKGIVRCSPGFPALLRLCAGRLWWRRSGEE